MVIILRNAGREIKLMSKQEFCRWVEIGPATLYKWIAEGKIEVFRPRVPFVMVGPEQDKAHFLMFRKKFRSQRKGGLPR